MLLARRHQFWMLVVQKGHSGRRYNEIAARDVRWIMTYCHLYALRIQQPRHRRFGHIAASDERALFGC